MSSSMGFLRPVSESEVALMRSWRNAPSVRNKMYTRHEISVEEHEKWWTQAKKRDDQLYLMYESQECPLGIVAFSGIDNVSKNSSWAFYSSPEAPRGTGSKMEFLALDYAFQELGLHKLYCEVLSHNEKVIKLHKKFGFQVEGVFRGQHRMGEGYVDVYRLGIFEEEWYEKRHFIKPLIGNA